MALERGFHRIVIMLSVVLLGVGVAFDAMTITPHATVEVALKDGREFVVERNEYPKEYLIDRESLAYALKSGYGEYKGTSKDFIAALRGHVSKDVPLTPPPGYMQGMDASEIESVKIVRGPSYWWWTDSSGTKIATGLVTFLWLAFYTVRWIGRGFAGR